jgi:hypothetical protein
LFFPSIESYSQITWDKEIECFKTGGSPVFLSGVNYVPSADWFLNLIDLDTISVANDMYSLHLAGVNCIRVYPLWNLLQPNPDQLNDEILKKLDKEIELAGRNKISIQISVFTGLMSSGIFMPKWTGGNIFTDKELIKGQVYLVREIAKRYKDNPYVSSYDFGNEINVLRRKLNLQATEAEIDQWMQAIYQGFKSGDPDKPVTNGIGTGYENMWRVENVAKSVDFFSSHSYVESHGTNLYDPYIGLRTTYSSDFLNAWSQMADKPVLNQEIGIPSHSLPDKDIGKYLQITMMSNWAAGHIGYFWWCSHNIDKDLRIKTDGLFPDALLKNNNVSPDDHVMGLLDEYNNKKDFTDNFTGCVKLINKLGIGWKSLLPKCYIVVRDNDDQKATMLMYINPYVIAKQIHMDVKLLNERNIVPEDAACVIIPGYSLGEKGKLNVGEYLAKGGIVYQSVYNDFLNEIKLTGEEKKVKDPVLISCSGNGALFKGQRIRLCGNVSVKDIRIEEGIEPVLVNLAQEDLFSREYGNGKPVLVKAKVGLGTYYYMAADLENSLMHIYDPWKSDNSDCVYSVLNPETVISVDSKYVELAYLQKEETKLIMLINHVDRFEDVIVKSKKYTSLVDVETGAEIGKKGSIQVRLSPGQIFTAYLN